MKRRTAIWAALWVLGLSGCVGGSGGDGGGGLGPAFDALNGRFSLDRDADCFLRILGSHITAEDGAGNAGCQEDLEGDNGAFAYSLMRSLNIDGTLTDQHIGGTLSYMRGDGYDGCEDTASYEITAEAQKASGLSNEEGRFAALAGVWNGSVTVEQRKQWCDEGDARQETIVYDFGADIQGRVAFVRYWQVGEPFDDTSFEIRDLDGDRLLIDGEQIETE